MKEEKKKEFPLDLEDIIKKSIDDYAIDRIKDAIDRTFPQNSGSYFERLKSQLLGPVAISALVLAMASWIAQYTVGAIEKNKQIREQQTSGYIDIFQKYKEAHRLRWLHGGMLKASLTWGHPYNIVQQRKIEYDTAYLTTNQLFPAARDYLDKALASNHESFYQGNGPSVFRNFYDKNLRDISTVHDFCLTASFAIRNNWEEALWSDALKLAPQKKLSDLKLERDTAALAQLDHCQYKGKYYRYGALAQVYSVCADVIFQGFEYAFQTNLHDDDEIYSEWIGKISAKVKDACNFSKAEVK